MIHRYIVKFANMIDPTTVYHIARAIKLYGKSTVEEILADMDEENIEYVDDDVITWQEKVYSKDSEIQAGLLQAKATSTIVY